ncbi:methyltransferase [Alsobacter metallidurans]|uniref:Methyltransferase n=1 Tax=Alsobacter metallidurans TaxID=340221 RepID=A0A917I9E3_9HYPH|nr:class I SAM-dependent methyltransferase [Alsobacter metallidurans]GGH22916.1 methyltransferase [Alsobacter metallidurans]
MSSQIRFDDGAAYERMMGTWSRIVGEQFIDWVKPQPGLRWADVGCGNGASTELLMRRCAPAQVHGVDPSPEQLAYARDRPGAAGATFHSGDAMALPFPDDAFDAAVAALVLFFIPDPAKGLAEMVRVTKPGGLVCAYLWDIPGGGLPHAAIGQELRASGIAPPLPPSAPISAMEPLRQLFADAGLSGIETTEITAQRRFDSFDDWFATSLLGSSLTIVAEQVGPEVMSAVKERVRAHFPGEPAGPVMRTARANAIKASKPA